MGTLKLNGDEALRLARRVIEIEARAVEGLAAQLDDGFGRAVNMILTASGRVIVSGMGKSGHVAARLPPPWPAPARPAYFVHPADASHGDLGMITRDDVMIALSNSGESGNCSPSCR